GCIGNCILARAPIRPNSAWKALGVIDPSRSVIKTCEDSPCSSKKRLVSSRLARERKLLRPLKVRSLASPALSSDALSKRTHSSSPVVSRVEVTRHQMSRRKFRSIGTVWSTVQWRKVGDAANRQSLNCLNSLKSLALPRGLEPLFSP